MRSKGNPHPRNTPEYWRVEFLNLQSDSEGPHSADNLVEIEEIQDRKAEVILKRLRLLETNTYTGRRGDLVRVRADAIALMTSCRAMAVPPSSGIVVLLQHCLGNPPSTFDLYVDQQWREFGASSDSMDKLLQCMELEATGYGPGDAVNITSLARAIDEPRRNVQRWRGTPAYQNCVSLIREDLLRDGDE